MLWWVLPTWVPPCTTTLTENLMCHKDQWSSCHWSGNQLAWTFQREGNSTNSEPTCSIHNNWYFPKHVWHFRLNVVVQRVHLRNTQHKISIGMKICVWEKPVAKNLDNESKETVKNTTWTTLYMRRGFSTQGKYILSFNMNSPSLHWIR